MGLFSDLIDELRLNILGNRDTFITLSNRNPNVAYQKLNDLASFVGLRHNLIIQIHFPDKRKIADVDSYGLENIGIVIDKFRKTFPVPRDTIKQKAIEIFDTARAQDAYMYEGKEGIRITIETGRLEVLPGSLHIWCVIDDRIKKFADWLMDNVYLNSAAGK